MLTLRLEVIGNLVPFPQLDREPDYDYQYDNYLSALIDLCDVLDETSIFKFQVSGFGQDRWPVDIRTDLLTILEQMPTILRSIECASYPFQLDFYEQGIERQLNFEEANTFIKISCYGGTLWEPNPSVYFVKESDILIQLYNLRDSFVEAVKIVCPKLASSELFATWYKNSGAKK